MTCDTHNIDAQRGGECTLLCDIVGNYTLSPSPDRSLGGFDGVVLFDISLNEGGKLKLAIDAADTIVDATFSNDRLGLVLFGSNDATIVSELIMCTTPVKQALRSSLREIKSFERSSENSFPRGMKLSLNLLDKDARCGGHIFILSDGKIPSASTDSPFWSNSHATVHSIAIGALTHRKALRHLRHQNGTLLEYRSPLTDAPRLTNLIAFLATQTHLHSIETLRCRLTFPPEQVNALDVLNQPSSIESNSQISVTLSPPPFLVLY